MPPLPGRHSACVIMLCLVAALFPTAGHPEVNLIAAPYVEYVYLTDMNGAVSILDRINEMAGNWLDNYQDFELFNHLLLIGTEFRVGLPDWGRGLDFLISISGTSGDAGMLGGKYDKRYQLKTLPDIPGLPILSFFSSSGTIDGTVRTRINQSLDYFIPIQLGIRHEGEPTGDMPLALFGSLRVGVVFIKSGLDIDINMNGTARSLFLSESFDGNFNGKASLKDSGWIADLTAGLRYDWSERSSSSIAAGLGLGEVRGRAGIQGQFRGGASNLDDVDIDINFNEPVTIKLNSFRLRCEILTWRW